MGRVELPGGAVTSCRREIVRSERKAGANRRNAPNSTEPRTPEGNAAVGPNALKRDLLSREVLLPGEGGEALKALHGLERRQAARHGASVPPPQVVDAKFQGSPKATAMVWLCFVIPVL